MTSFLECQDYASTKNHTTLDNGNVPNQIAIFVISIAAIVLGVPGNILIIHAVRSHKQMQNARNYFIVSLACTDIVALLVAVPFYILNFVHILCYMPEAVCKILMPTGQILVVISVYTHVAIALERRRAIVFPLLPKPSPRRIKTFIIIVWMIPVIVTAPPAYLSSKLYLGSICLYNDDLGKAFLKTYLFTFAVTNFVIPLAVLIWSYRQVVRSLKQNLASIEELAETNAAVSLRLKNQQKVVKCLISLVSTFVALTSPFHLSLILSVSATTLYPRFTVTFNLLALCIHFLLYALNPIILYVSSTEFRLAINESLKCGRGFFFRIYSSFNKCKDFNGDRSQTSPSVVALSITSTGF